MKITGRRLNYTRHIWILGYYSYILIIHASFFCIPGHFLVRSSASRAGEVRMNQVAALNNIFEIAIGCRGPNGR